MNYKKIIITLSVLFIAYFGYKYIKFHAPAIEFEYMSLTDLEGHPVSLDEFRGKNVFIDIWGTWCIDCIKSMPSVNLMQKKLDPSKWVVLGLNNDELQKTKAFIERHELEFNCWHMNKRYDEYGIRSIPCYYILGPNGNLLYKTTDQRDWASEESLKLLRKFE